MMNMLHYIVRFAQRTFARVDRATDRIDHPRASLTVRFNLNTAACYMLIAALTIRDAYGRLLCRIDDVRNIRKDA